MSVKTQELAMLGTKPINLKEAKKYVKELDPETDLECATWLALASAIAQIGKAKKRIYKRFDALLKEGTTKLKIGDYVFTRVIIKEKVVTAVSERAEHYTEKLAELDSDWEDTKEKLLRKAKLEYDSKRLAILAEIKKGTSSYERNVTKSYSIAQAE